MKLLNSEQLKEDSGSGDFALGSGAGVTVCDALPGGQKVVTDLQVCVTWGAQNLEVPALSHSVMSHSL